MPPPIPSSPEPARLGAALHRGGFMYEQFFGLRERPFELTPNPRYLLLTARHKEALSNLEYGVAARRGLTVLTGEAGTGKTTLVRRAVGRTWAARAERPGVYLTISNPTLTRAEFVEYLATSLGLSPHAASSKAGFLIEIERTLLGYQREGMRVALVVDEAQSMPDELLEEIRLLANIETDTEKLLPILLVGQPELADRLNEPGLRQLKQRIALRCRLEPLELAETASYVATRIAIAGGNAAEIFTREAVHAVHRRSRGIPRLINVICDNALITGFALDRCPVGEGVIAEVAADFDLEAPRAAGRVDPPIVPPRLQGTPVGAGRGPRREPT